MPTFRRSSRADVVVFRLELSANARPLERESDGEVDGERRPAAVDLTSRRFFLRASDHGDSSSVRSARRATAQSYFTIVV